MEERLPWYKRFWVWIGLLFISLIVLGFLLFARQTYIYYQQIKTGQNPGVFMEVGSTDKKQVSEYEKKKVQQLKEQARGKYDQPYLGSEDAVHEVVEFVDFGCPYCKQALKELHTLANVRSDVKIIIRDFPIKELHPNAEVAAQAALCVWNNDGQEKYWKYHDLLFA
ncbi:thioredoxin domain-containing protein, partial [Patescibacteria group bacterium]|nr:thioredoxin domain-containing protein [Patescibacteria group bacterium]